MYGEWIKAAREDRGLTMAQVEATGVITIDGLSKIERNVNGASMKTLEKLAEVYGVQIGDLLPHSEPKVEDPVFGPVRTALEHLSEAEQMLVISNITSTAQMFAALSHARRDAAHKDNEREMESSAPLPIVMPGRVRRSKDGSGHSGSARSPNKPREKAGDDTDGDA